MADRAPERPGPDRRPRRLRVLILVARDPAHPEAAGGDNHVDLIARELSAAGHEVTVWTAGHPGLAPEETLHGVRYRRLAPSRLLAPSVWARLALGGALPFDVVFEEVIGGERTPFLAAVFARPKSVGMWYQDNRSLFRSTYGGAGAALGARVQSALLRLYRTRPLITPSESSRRWLTGEGGHRAPVVVHTPTVTRPPVERVLPFSERSNRFVSIGKFRPLKRFEEAIDVTGVLRRAVPDAELVLIGRADAPEYLEGLRRRAAAPALGGSVRFVVDASEAEKFELLAGAKALTIHSPVEGFGWTVPEAGLCGVPVVANTGTPADVVAEGRNGTRLPFGAVDRYAQVLARWMRDPGEWGRYSEGARAEALRHTRTTAPPELLELFLEVAGDAPRVPVPAGSVP